MNVEVYYFSGTGNSLLVARDIAFQLEARLISIPSVVEQAVLETNADVIGIVFPVYNQGMPFIINRFVGKLSNLGNRYIFGVCTHGGGAGLTMKYLEELINGKGGKLSSGYAVPMPYNYITPAPVLKGFYSSFRMRETDIEQQYIMLSDWKKRLEQVCKCIKELKVCSPETDSEVIEALVDFLGLREALQKPVWLKVAGYKDKTELTFRESIRYMDYGFRYDNKCTGCGICSQICPVKNIDISGGHPSWKHNCEQCFACLQWCPNTAVQFREGTINGKRYHNPEISLSDMLKGNGT